LALWLSISGNARSTGLCCTTTTRICGDQRRRIGVHACRGAESDQTHVAEVDYALLCNRARDDVRASTETNCHRI
jgi:hypothetical protein